MNRELETETPIEDCPEWPDVIQKIIEYGNWNKPQLVEANYDESGENLTKNELKAMSRGELIAMLIDSFYGSTCH